MLQVVFYVSLTLGVCGGGVVLDSCTPTCQNHGPGEMVADPTNCRRYYVCLHNGQISDFTENCEHGELFDGVDGECKAENDVVCHVCRPSCTYTCPADASVSSVIADHNSCNIFHLCVPGYDIVDSSCTDDTPFFDGTSCTANSSRCCDQCTPFCPDAYMQIADPTNCTNFYYCGKEGYPDDTNLYHCPVGNFDEKEGVCMEGAPCLEPCAGGITSIPTKTTPISTTTPTSGGAICYEQFKCNELGYFPKCLNRCDPHYYRCMLEDIGHYVEARACTHNNLINPDIIKCVAPEQCPYPPNT